MYQFNSKLGVLLCASLVAGVSGCSGPSCIADASPEALIGACTDEEQALLDELMDCVTGEVACNETLSVSDECLGVLREWAPPVTADCAKTYAMCHMSQLNVGLAVASYVEQETAEQMPEGMTLGRTFGGADGKGHAVLAFSHPENPVCHVAFRGTDSGEDVKVDIDSMKKIDCTDAQGRVFGRCGRGVHEMIESLWSFGLRDELLSLVEQGECPGGVQLSGHSLGGAVASVMAGTLQSEAPETFHLYYMSVYTFGEPRMVDDETADRLHERVNKLRWVNWGDPVPAVLGDGFGFKHFGTARELYGHNGNYSIDVKHQDYTSYTLSPTKVAAHMSSVYQERLATCGGVK